MAIYHPKKPQYNRWGTFISIATRIIFPPILLWDLLKFATNRLIGEAVGGFILKAQHIDFSDRYINHTQTLNNQETHLHHALHTVITHDGSKLDTLEITHKSQQLIPMGQQKYIINFVGNSTVYENIVADMQADAKALHCHVIGFNFRGVGRSSGRSTSKDDLVTDGITQVQQLLEQGVSPHNITLKGHSLGASIASLVAYHFHQQCQPINLFNGRSFSSITNIVVGWIRTGRQTGHEETFGRKLLGWLFKPFIKLALLLTKWEIDADDAFKAIPDEHKEYVVVRTPRQERNRYVLDDVIIPHYASIHLALKDERRAKKAALAGNIQALTEIKTLFNERKMENTDLYEENGHQVGLRHLVNRSGKTALAFFREFVQRTHEHHAIHIETSLTI